MAGTSTQDNTPAIAPEPEKPKRERAYTVLRRIDARDIIEGAFNDEPLYVALGQATGSRDIEAIEQFLENDQDTGPFVAVSRFNERSPKVEQRVRRSWG
jgi:hypothetical protein